jgi:patatin-like phospholipase/acyl hydrolase
VVLSSLKMGQNMTVYDIILATTAAPYFFPAHEVPLNGVKKMKLFFQDGGVMANDPGLINACFTYKHFTPSLMNETRSFPMFRLLRVGCGKEETWTDSPVKCNTLQGGTIVTQLADIFMGSDVCRTHLLAKVSDQQSNYFMYTDIQVHFAD